MLALLDFSKPFCIECDALGKWVGLVLQQKGRPIFILSQALKGKTLLLSTYEKEFYALVMAIQKWRSYLLERSFIVKTDHNNLKHPLNQKIGIPM